MGLLNSFLCVYIYIGSGHLEKCYENLFCFGFFSFRYWSCSDSAVFVAFLLDIGAVHDSAVFVVFLLDIGAVHDSAVFVVFLLDIGAVPTVRYLLFLC
jgi:hypothetical protein